MAKMSFSRALAPAAAAGAALPCLAAPGLAAASTPKLGSTGVPVITISSPFNGASYQRHERVIARFRCTEAGSRRLITRCHGPVRVGHRVNTRWNGVLRFTVSATDASGHTVTKVVRYKVWQYVNPFRAIPGLGVGRIDMGVDYSGSGPIEAIGKARITFASNNDSGPLSCWGISCWPGGGIVVYKLSAGPFAHKFVYVAENVTATVHAGQIVRPGQTIAILHLGSPSMETGWAAGRGAETLAIERGHQCTCGDPGGWSSIEGQNFDRLLVWLGAPSGSLQATAPGQSMPRHWPGLPREAALASLPRSTRQLPEGWTAR
jgi:hypothetical protein